MCAGPQTLGHGCLAMNATVPSRVVNHQSQGQGYRSPAYVCPPSGALRRLAALETAMEPQPSAMPAAGSSVEEAQTKGGGGAGPELIRQQKARIDDLEATVARLRAELAAATTSSTSPAVGDDTAAPQQRQQQPDAAASPIEAARTLFSIPDDLTDLGPGAPGPDLLRKSAAAMATAAQSALAAEDAHSLLQSVESAMRIHQLHPNTAAPAMSRAHARLRCVLGYALL
eukprot:COSAG01_NODE_7487_length_3189_cov_201.714239_3_plen_228_part_00